MSVHVRLVEPVLARLDGERAAYFGDVVQRLDKDPRAEPLAHLLFLVLRQTVEHLPPYLPADDLVHRLIAFVEANHLRLMRIIYDKAFVTDPGTLRAVTDRLVESVAAEVLDRYRDGTIESDAPRIKRFKWPYQDTDFPYDEPDGNDDG